MAEASAPVPAPRFADAFAAKIRTQAAEQRLRRRRIQQRRMFAWRVPGFGMASAAAAIAIFAGLLIPAFRSLPGDSLYSLKRTAENARVAVVSGPTEAHLRLRLAAQRFQEVEQLIERAQVKEVGPGLAALGVAQDIKDPELAKLIEATIADAQEQIEAAATILIAEPSDAKGLDDLVVVVQAGRKLAERVAQDLPEPVQPPVLNTVVTLAKIEAQAKAARMMVEPPPPPPCATPTPTPEATPTGSPAATETPTSTPEPTVTPEPTPCVSPSPTPTPVTTPTPSPSPSPEPASATSASSEPEQTGGPSNDDNRRSEGSQRWTTPQPGSPYGA
jgi:hypothetical protein